MADILDAYERGDRENQQVRAQVSDFKGQTYFSIRAWYRTEEGEYKPAKNGINLPKDEYKEFRKLIDALDEELNYTGPDEEDE